MSRTTSERVVAALGAFFKTCAAIAVGTAVGALLFQQFNGETLQFNWVACIVFSGIYKIAETPFIEAWKEWRK